MSVGSEATDRVLLARLSLEAATSHQDVVRSEAGPVGLWSTGDGPEWLAGVVCLPLAEGGYTVELHLVARLVPLPGLAESIRDRIERRALAAGFREEIRRLDIAFEDVDEGVSVHAGNES